VTLEEPDAEVACDRGHCDTFDAATQTGICSRFNDTGKNLATDAGNTFGWSIFDVWRHESRPQKRPDYPLRDRSYSCSDIEYGRINNLRNDWSISDLVGAFYRGQIQAIWLMKRHLSKAFGNHRLVRPAWTEIELFMPNHGLIKAAIEPDRDDF